jgi:hypothetical protein
MTTAKIIEGLTILEKYHNHPDGYNCDAEHDVLHAHRTDRPLKADDLSRMIAIGWLQERRDLQTDGYDPEEGWCCFT